MATLHLPTLAAAFTVCPQEHTYSHLSAGAAWFVEVFDCRNSTMRKWRCCTFLHTGRCSLFFFMRKLCQSLWHRTTATCDLGRAPRTSEGRKFELVPKAPQFELQYFILCGVLKRLCEQLGSSSSAVSDSCLVLFLCGCSQRVYLVFFVIPAHVVLVNVLPYCGFVLELRCGFGGYGYTFSWSTWP